MKRVIFVHGYTSSPKKTKYQVIARELDRLGVEYSIPALPGGDYPHSEDWLKIIDKEVEKTNKPVVLVGHSLGTRTVLLYLDKFERKVDTVILFAAFDNNYIQNRERRDECYSDFFEYAIDTEKVKKLANKFIVVHSRDDDSIPYQQSVNISKDLGADLITYEHMKHFSGEERAEDNAKEFLKIVKSVL